MHQVKTDGDWDLCFPDTNHARYDEEWDGDIQRWREKGYPVKVYQTVKARKIWRKIWNVWPSN